MWGGGCTPEVVCSAEDGNLHLQEVRRELMAAVLHHDDGWAAWEASPAIDPVARRPYSFMELPRRESLVLWRDSILHARQMGPLAAWVVAGHFAQLLEDSADVDREISEHWLAEVVAWRDAWLAEWRSLNRPVHTPALADDCQAWLRLFDWLSLWLCCYCPSRPGDATGDVTTLAEGPLTESPVAFSPASQPITSDAQQVTVSPWPFVGDVIEIDVLGYAVPTRQYTTPGELAKSRSPLRLRWRLVPGG